MTDGVRQDHEISAGVERRTRRKERRPIFRRQQRLAAGAGPVKQQDGIVDRPLRVPVRLPERRVVQAQPQQHLAIAEPVVREGGVRLVRRRRRRRIRLRTRRHAAACIRRLRDGPGRDGGVANAIWPNIVIAASYLDVT